MGSNWSSTTTAAYAYYSNDPTYNLIYGKWYNWYAVDDSRGLCPTGWHVATNQEWLDLEIMLGGASLAGGVLKSTSSLWNSSAVIGTNDIGFTALPNGMVGSDGNGGGMNYYGNFWTSTSYDSNRSYFRELRYDSQYLTSPYGRIISQGYGMACRCVKD